MHRVHLTGKGMSQRGVRYKTLTMPEVDKITQAADRLISTGTTVAEYNSMVEKMCLEMMIQEVSDPCKEEELPKANWKKVGPDELAMEWSKYFGVKDTAVIKTLHQNEHSVSKQDIDAILEKKIEELSD